MPMEGRLFDEAELDVKRSRSLIVGPDLKRDLVTTMLDGPRDTRLHKQGSDSTASPVGVDHHADLGKTRANFYPQESDQLTVCFDQQRGRVLGSHIPVERFSTGLAIERAFSADPSLLARDRIEEGEPRLKVSVCCLTDVQGALILS
jgi:hypothetical protein